jgi:hypothetical protein
MRKLIKLITICLVAFAFLGCNNVKNNRTENSTIAESEAVTETTQAVIEADTAIFDSTNIETKEVITTESTEVITERNATPKVNNKVSKSDTSLKEDIKKILVVEEQVKEVVNQEISFFDFADSFFKKSVQNGKVTYSSLKANGTMLNEMVAMVENRSVSRSNPNEYKAFYINAYNIITIKSLASNYPIKSPLDIDGFFKVKKHKVAGEMLTLDQIENVKLRKEFNDARIHFVVVCGALSCPPIIESAYIPASLNAQMTKQARSAINSDFFVKVDDSAKEVAVSMIMKWYKEDFVKDGQTTIDYLNKYRNTQIPINYKVTYQEYNWTINAR